jgi:phosphoribosylformylglycinamidine synthase
MTRVGVVTFPGSLDDADALRAIRLANGYPVSLWHADPDLHRVEAVVLPGGFSYGDYLRCGAIARFAPVMETIAKAAADGMPVLGICNGFQILCEAHLLPGALTRNAHLHFRTRDQWLRIESAATPWTAGFTPGQEIRIPVKNGEGRYVADERTLDELEAQGRVVARYVAGPTAGSGTGASAGTRQGGSAESGSGGATVGRNGESAGSATRRLAVTGGAVGGGAPRGLGNPNGSQRDIAAIRNEAGNVVGIMPHPEHAVEALTGPSMDGLEFFVAVLRHLGARA